MRNFTAASRPASWQSQELCRHYWRTSSSVSTVLTHCTSVQLPACFKTTLNSIQLQQNKSSGTKHGSLYSAVSSCASLNSETFKIVEYMLKGCEQVVGKVVISLAQAARRCSQIIHLGKLGMEIVLEEHSLLAVCEQVYQSCTQTFLLILKESLASFYTLPTGPTNTTNLSKGINL